MPQKLSSKPEIYLLDEKHRGAGVPEIVETDGKLALQKPRRVAPQEPDEHLGNSFAFYFLPANHYFLLVGDAGFEPATSAV